LPGTSCTCHGARTNRELSAAGIGGIADACHAWRGEVVGFKPSEDVPGFCAAADLDAIRGHTHVLIPGQCVGSEPVEGDGEPPVRRSAG
jgi:type I restriction enzyme M protein